MANKIKKGDTVKIIAGNSKGMSGEVYKVVTDINGKPSKVYVSGVNIHKKIIKVASEQGMPAEKQRVDREYPVDVSNVSLIDSSSGAVSKVGFKLDEKTGKKARFFKKSGNIV